MKRFATIVVLLGLANAFVAAAAALVLGGDATGGKIEGGRYFVENRGTYTEVSRRAWTYSRIHTRSVEISGPFVVAGLFTVAYLQMRRRLTRTPEAPTAAPDGASPTEAGGKRGRRTITEDRLC